MYVKSPKAVRFEEFDAQNPNVYATLCRLAKEWVSHFNRRVGMQALFEQCRWQIAIETNDPEFRMNNDWAPWYSRKLAIYEPDLRNAFEFRHSEADEWAMDLIRRREAGGYV